MQKIIALLREFFFPRGCALCGKALINADESFYGLCEDCREGLREEEGEKCDLCGRPLISEIGRCISCRKGGEQFYDRLVVVFPYTGKYQKLISSYKFDGHLALGNYFAEILAEKIMEIVKEIPSSEVAIVPVPPRPGKIRKNGWDQVEYIVKKLKIILGQRVKIEKCLKRLNSKAQKQLNREARIKNLKGRILLRGKALKNSIVIDDVLTTGATMNVCAQALKEGGSEKVIGLCLFYG